MISGMTKKKKRISPPADICHPSIILQNLLQVATCHPTIILPSHPSIILEFFRPEMVKTKINTQKAQKSTENVRMMNLVILVVGATGMIILVTHSEACIYTSV